MKITTLFVLFLLFSVTLFAQTPVSDRDQIHREQTITEARNLQLQLLEETRLRLVEAISDGDLDSSVIMQQEIMVVMERQIAQGLQWLGENGQYPPLDRMKSILVSFTQLDFGTLGTEKSREAGNMVTEFANLLGRAPF